MYVLYSVVEEGLVVKGKLS